MKKFEIIREIFATVMRCGFNDDKQDAISEYTKDKMTNKIYVKKILTPNIANIDSIAVTALESDFSDACDSDLRIAFNDKNIGKRVILYANEVEYGILEGIQNYLRTNYGKNKDEDCYNQVVNQISYLESQGVPTNLPMNELRYILMRFRNEIIDKNKS